MLVLVCSLGTTIPIQSSDQATDYSQELDQLRSQIERLKKDASKYQQQRRTAEKEIAGLEHRLISIEARRTGLEQDFVQHNHEYEKLNERKKTQVLELERQSAALQNLIRASFAISRLDYIKILLSEDNPSRLSRTVAYYRYLTADRTNRIKQLQTLGLELEETEHAMQQNRMYLEELSIRLSNQRDDLSDLQADMRKTIALNDQRLEENQATLHKMKAEESRLLDLIDSLERNDAVRERAEIESFAGMKGKLSLPVKSRIQARFGQQKPIRGAYWNGLLLSSTSGQDVRSIFAGQVVYSSSFDGFGVLVIIDHGEDFMSLYAYNTESNVQVGDRVATQQIIATAGDYSDHPSTGLYFELRKAGSPIDPLLWCRL